MTRRRIGPVLGIVAILSGCGGGDGGGGGTPPPAPPSIGPAPPTSVCSLVERQNWAAAQLNGWYLFPELLPAGASPAGFPTVDAYIDHLTAAARAQGKDRYFTYLTSIAEENAYYGSGASAGFGFRLSIDTAQRRLFVSEAFEGAPALAAGIDRGTEILAIGSSASNLRTVDSIIASEGTGGVYNALGPANPGVTRHLRVSNAGGTREVAVAKADYSLLPVSTRYGARIIDDGGRRVGYLNLRTFISTADSALRDAFAQFRAEGITDFVIDLRYNGGGLIDTAELMGDLLGRNRSPSDVLGYTTFRPSKSQYDETRNFSPRPQSVAPTRIAFIATGGTASASEVVMNSMIPWLGDRVALIGTDTYGKPVGQIGQDRPACDDRLRVVAFRTENRDRQGDYYNGLASKMPVTCQAGDDLSVPLGDPREASIATALDFLAGRSCAPIGGVGALAMREDAQLPRRELLRPARPTTVQREVPGIF